MRGELSTDLKSLHDELTRVRRVSPPEKLQWPDDWIEAAICQRTASLAASVDATVRQCAQLSEIVQLLLRWMQEGTIVRVLGAGRARLAAAIPANRLAHGGARVYIQDDMMPMPHTIKGGGIIAASASGKTETVLDALRIIQSEAPHIKILGIASDEAREFKNLCHYFIGIHDKVGEPNPLRALADIGEYVISETLDALVVAAGRLGGFDERMWRLGHENVGATGPYDARMNRIELLFNELY